MSRAGSRRGVALRRLAPPNRLTRMHRIELNDDELRIVYAALHSYLDDFGHEEADVLRQVKQILAKLPEPPHAGA